MGFVIVRLSVLVEVCSVSGYKVMVGERHEVKRSMDLNRLQIPRGRVISRSMTFIERMTSSDPK